jgi:membrane associated rhomboid family serine protease
LSLSSPASGVPLVTRWLVLINIVVFALDFFVLPRLGIVVVVTDGVRKFVYPLLDYLGHFSAAAAFGEGQVWRLITFQFLHGNLQHLLVNMLSLWSFGPIAEQYLGRRRFLLFYLWCGVGGAMLYMLLWLGGILPGTGASTPLVGASAGIFGVIVAAAMLKPHDEVTLLFPPMDVEMRTLAWIMLPVAAGIVIFAGPNAGGEAAHLGGAAVGWWLIRRAMRTTPTPPGLPPNA